MPANMNIITKANIIINTKVMTGIEKKSVEHLYEQRPWGSYEILDKFDAGDGKDVCVKRIVVKPNQRLSYQSHRLRGEHWFFVQGEGKAILNDDEHAVRPGRSVEIPIGTKHRVINTDDNLELVFIEVSTGKFDEEDIERYEDDYGRADSQ